MHTSYTLLALLSFVTYTYPMEIHFIDAQGNPKTITIDPQRHDGVSVYSPTKKIVQLEAVELIYPGEEPIKRLMSQQSLTDLIESGKAREVTDGTIRKFYFYFGE